VDEFPGQEDVLRYVLCANAPETKDNDFTWKDFQQRNNSELVAIFGNFVNRAVVLTQKYFGGKVPRNLKPEAIDAETLARIPECRRNLEGYLDTFHFREALKEAMNIARIGNKYISDTEPWKVAKTDMDRCASILYTSLQICANLAIAFEPFTPFSAAKLRDILKVGVSAGSDYRAGEGAPTENFYTASEGSAIHTLASDGREEPVQSGLREHFLAPVDGLPGDIVLTWENLGERELLPAGHELGETVLLFAKIEDGVVEAQIAKLHATKAANESSDARERAYTVEPQKEMCTYDDFQKLDIRTATVLEAERVPNTDKLLKLTIDTGIDRRTIVSGIAEYYSPEQMLGKQICILANLQPRVIRGIESKGMILMAEQPDGKMRFITPQEVLADGSQIN
jgi:methionyl-tRNA synthetase